jgi:ankyrin repeat protein
MNATLGGCLSPLVAALYKRHFDIAELLYQHGADVGIRGYKRRTILHAASAGGFVDIVQWLLDRCVAVHSRQDNQETPLHLAEANGYMRHGKCVDAADNVNRVPLHLASRSGHFEIVRLLIEHGAEVTSRDGNDQTPLHLASSRGSAETVRLLLNHSVDVNALDGSHKSPLHLASFLVSAKQCDP